MASYAAVVKSPDGVESNSVVTNGVHKRKIVSSIPSVPVTEERKPFIQPDDDQPVKHTGKLASYVQLPSLMMI
jgi:hypothetical protein